MDLASTLSAIRPLGMRAAAKRGMFGPLSLPLNAAMTVGGMVPKDDARSMGLRKAYADKQRQAILGQVNAQPAPGQELGAGLPSTATAIRGALKWLQNNADPNPQSYAPPAPGPAAPAAAPAAPAASAVPSATNMGAAPLAPAMNMFSSSPMAPTPGSYDPTGGISPAYTPKAAPAPTPAAAPAASGGGIGSDYATSAGQNASYSPFSPFFGAGFGAGGSGFGSPANMGQGSTSPDIATLLSKLLG